MTGLRDEEIAGVGFFDVFKGHEIDACGQWGDGIGVVNPVSGNNKLGNNIAGSVFYC